MNKKQSVIKKYNEALDILGVGEDEIISQVRYQLDISKAYVAPIRNELQADFLLFKDDKDNKEKLGDTTLFNVHTAYMARSYVDYPRAKFDATIYGTDDAVKGLNAAYIDDFEESDMQIVKYYKDFFKYLFGVGIIIRSGWDGENKRNKFQWVDPRIWLPDPSGDYTSGNYSYSAFEKIAYKSELEAMGFMNVDLLGVGNESSGGAKETRQGDRANSGLANIDDDIYDPAYEICYDFCKIYSKKTNKFHKCCVVTGNNGNTILSLSVIPPVSEEEKENPELIRFPLAFYYWKPLIGNQFGDRIANKVRDVQRTKAIMANLRLKKEKAELYPMYLYNTRYVSNKADLSFGFNKFIGVNTGDDGAVPLDSIVRPMAKDFRADNSFNIENSLDKQVEASTSIGKIALGTTQERREGVGTNRLIMTNTDINLEMNTKIDGWGEIQFVREWLRGYLENFSEVDKKFVLVNTGITTVPLQLTKRDFLVGLQCKIKIVTVSEKDRENNNNYRALQSWGAMLLQYPDIPDVSKLAILRDMLESAGFSENKIQTRVPKSIQQIIQEQENAILMSGIPVDVRPEDDDLTHLMVLKGAGTSLEVAAHEQAHIQQWISKGQPKIPQMSGENSQIMESLVSQGASQMSAQAIKAMDNSL